MGKRLQFVWWGFRWMVQEPRHVVRFKRLDPEQTDLALIYKWTLALGPLEIRRWRRYRRQP